MEIVGVKHNCIVEQRSLQTYTKLFSLNEPQIHIVSTGRSRRITSSSAIVPRIPTGISSKVALVHIVITDVNILIEYTIRSRELKIVHKLYILLKEFLIAQAPAQRNSR